MVKQKAGDVVRQNCEWSNEIKFFFRENFFKYNFEIHILPQYSVPVLLLSMLLLPAAAKRIHKSQILWIYNVYVNYKLTPEIPEDAKVQHD